MQKIKLSSRIYNLIGQQFERLVVIEFAGLDNQRKACWKCKCNCGKEIIVRAHELRNGHTKSCGCLRKKLPKGEAAFNFLYYGYKDKSKKRNLEFNLSKSVFRILITSDCYYCGTKPIQICHQPDLNGNFIYNGIDRIDNTKGYIINNCVSCCWPCNKLKSDLRYNEFIFQIKKIVNHLKGKNCGVVK